MKKTSKGFICFHNACHDLKLKKFLIFTDENFCVFQGAYYLLRGEQEEMKQYESGGSNVMFFLFFFSDLSRSQTNEKGHGSQLSSFVDLFSRAVSRFAFVCFLNV